MTDAAGSVLLGGSFLGAMDLGGGALTTAGSDDVFLARFSADGAHVSSVRIGGEHEPMGAALAAGADGHALVTGYFEGTRLVGCDARSARLSPFGEGRARPSPKGAAALATDQEP